jgi:hypothetical protein
LRYINNAIDERYKVLNQLTEHTRAKNKNKPNGVYKDKKKGKSKLGQRQMRNGSKQHLRRSRRNEIETIRTDMATPPRLQPLSPEGPLPLVDKEGDKWRARAHPRTQATLEHTLHPA